jgi:rhodanese-related sulfurtransferase
VMESLPISAGRRIVLLISLALALSCQPSGKQPSAPDREANASITTFDGAAGKLIEQLQLQGDYVNSRQFPSMIKAETVHEELGGNMLLIDLRKKEFYIKGHIRGAVNVRRSEILDYFENDILPFKYNKIILVCYSGHLASYTTQILRLMGYGNVYAMRYGMSGWHHDFAKDFWLAGISSDHEDELVAKTGLKPPSTYQPVLQTRGITGEEILNERARAALSDDNGPIFIDQEEVFQHPDDYFIINFERKDKYESGHIPGAVRYKPQGTLGIPSEMSTIPTDKTIVVYCDTGHTSQFAVAYLRLFGFDARSMTYGNNGFMHHKMVQERDTLSWHPFTEEDIHDFPYVTGIP